MDCCEKTFPRLIQRIEESFVAFADENGKKIPAKDDSKRPHAVYNSSKGCYDNPANPRVNLLQLWALFGPDKTSDENRALLEVFNDKVYGSLREALPNTYTGIRGPYPNSNSVALTVGRVLAVLGQFFAQTCA